MGTTIGQQSHYMQQNKPHHSPPRRALQHSLTEARAEGAPEAPGTVPRLAWTLQHALTSITATSFTTVAAFAANLTSSITPVRLFGLFMVVLVLVNYVFVLTLLLALLVLREGKGEASGEQGEKQGLLAPATELVPLGGVRSASPSERISPCDEPPGALSDAPSREEARAQSSTGASTSASQGAAEGSAQYGTLGPERRRGRGCCRCIGPDGGRLAAHAWLGGPFADALYAARWGVVAAAALAVAFFGWRASLLTLPSSRPTVWRAGSNIHKYYDLVRISPRKAYILRTRFCSAVHTASAAPNSGTRSSTRVMIEG